MRFIIIAWLLFLFVVVVAACPPDDEDTAKISGPLGDKFKKGEHWYAIDIIEGASPQSVFVLRLDICGQGIKPGGAADLKWVQSVLLPYYISKKWLTKEPPAGRYWFQARDCPSVTQC